MGTRKWVRKKKRCEYVWGRGEREKEGESRISNFLRTESFRERMREKKIFCYCAFNAQQQNSDMENMWFSSVNPEVNIHKLMESSLPSLPPSLYLSIYLPMACLSLSVCLSIYLIESQTDIDREERQREKEITIFLYPGRKDLLFKVWQFLFGHKGKEIHFVCHILTTVIFPTRKHFRNHDYKRLNVDTKGQHYFRILFYYFLLRRISSVPLDFETHLDVIS